MTGTATDTVTWTPQATPVWNDDLVINGRTYPTRHPAPPAAKSHEYLAGLTDAQRDEMRAVHESAHAVTGLAAGACVHHAQISTTADLRNEDLPATGRTGGYTPACNITDGLGFLVFLGAGERAENRWLCEQGLWTPARAVGVELGAYGDRRHVLDLNPHLGFEGGSEDYSVVHHFADQSVSEHWSAITAVAQVLVTRLFLTGDEIADLTGLPNGTHSSTCNFV